MLWIHIEICKKKNNKLRSLAVYHSALSKMTHVSVRNFTGSQLNVYSFCVCSIISKRSGAGSAGAVWFQTTGVASAYGVETLNVYLAPMAISNSYDSLDVSMILLSFRVRSTILNKYCIGVSKLQLCSQEKRICLPNTLTCGLSGGARLSYEVFIRSQLVGFWIFQSASSTLTPAMYLWQGSRASSISVS